ncbi:hypothetical protein ACFQL1_13965 [Halomicroarcula sp. GCM10025709]|uniref:hypothetical protein n=1 Tax=Haloarcula TaxID=2237 RepID=UPI0024C37D4E|nr:hypothetical protein [Halomicroarcula sp. YJ-61-S]
MSETRTTALKWGTIVAALLSFAIIGLVAVYRPAHEQALINLLLGEIGALAIGHTAYRISSGKQASPLGAGAAVFCGLVLAGTPFVFANFDPFLTIQLVCGLVLAVAGLGALAERYVGGEEGRRTGAERIASRSGN